MVCGRDNLIERQTEGFDTKRMSAPQPSQHDLDAMLEDALSEYELQQQAQPQQQPAAAAAAAAKKVTPGEVFAPNESDLDSTVEALLSALAVSGGSKDGEQSDVQAATAAATAPSATLSSADQAAEREADEYLRNFLANVAKQGAETTEDESAAVVGLLGPFVSKDMLYPPLREIRERVCRVSLPCFVRS